MKNWPYDKIVHNLKKLLRQMLEHFKKFFSPLSLSESEHHKVDTIYEYFKNTHYVHEDPWGLNLEKTRKSLEYIIPLYKRYFKVRVFGKEHVDKAPYTIVANHSGQIAIDAILISTAFALDINPPRILRPMVERFVTKLPFIWAWMSECGAVLGDRQNCLNLLKKGESVLVFPEGVRGVAKSTYEFYQLKRFTRGFFRLSVDAGVDVLPIAVIGAEEFFPLVYQAKDLAKKLQLPALPLSPTFIPLPSPVDIYIGEPYKIPKDLNVNSTDEEVDEHIHKIEARIKELTEYGLSRRRKFWANVKGPN